MSAAGGAPRPTPWDTMSATPIRLSGEVRRPGPEPLRPNGDVVLLTPPKGFLSPRFRAVMTALGGIAAGLALWVLLLFMNLFALFMGTPMSLRTMIILSVIPMVGGIVLAIATYNPDDARPRIEVGTEAASLYLSGFRKPLIVPRLNVRLVDIEYTKGVPFRKNYLFPITDPLPEAVFEDAVGRPVLNPWDPGEPKHPVPRDPVPLGQHAVPEWLDQMAKDGGNDPLARQARIDAPPRPEPAETEPGWANVGGRNAPPEPRRRGHLFTADGSALPFARTSPLDFPNVAMIFNTPVRLPKRTVYVFGCSLPFTTARSVAGVMVTAKRPEEAAGAFARWNVVRHVTADDVLEKGLRPPKPLKGMRGLLYAASALGFVLVRALAELLERLF